MRKTILMLINGFGIERSTSANIYSPKLMPNLDRMTNEVLFGSLSSEAGDYNNAYRMFSIPEKGKSEEDEIDNLIFDKKLDDNPVLKNLKDSLTDQNKLHIFYTIETGKKWNQVREFLRIINANKDKKVFIHFILTGTSTANYDSIIKIISKISFEMSEYCKIGFVVGKNKINTDDVLRSFYREFGEHWNESTKKFEILKKEIVNPEDAGVFIINSGMALAEGDSVFFLNYEDVEMQRFYDDFTKMSTNLFSLYKLYDAVPNMFTKNTDIASSLSTMLENYGIKLLVMTEQSRVNDVNFYLNGMQKKRCPNITYAINDLSLFSSKESVINLVDGNAYDGIILDFNIGILNRAEDIRTTLANIDNAIAFIREASKEKDYTFIISSLYGMHAPIMDGVVQKVVDFSGKVPCIYQNNTFTKGEYVLNGGNIYSLCLTFLTNIDDDVKSNKLVHKLTGLEKMLTKK